MPGKGRSVRHFCTAVAPHIGHVNRTCRIMWDSSFGERLQAGWVPPPPTLTGLPLRLLRRGNVRFDSSFRQIEGGEHSEVFQLFATVGLKPDCDRPVMAGLINRVGSLGGFADVDRVCRAHVPITRATPVPALGPCSPMAR